MKNSNSYLGYMWKNNKKLWPFIFGVIAFMFLVVGEDTSSAVIGSLFGLFIFVVSGIIDTFLYFKSKK